MRSGSQLQSASSRQVAASITPRANQYSPQRDILTSLTDNDVDEFSWPEDATLVPCVSGYLCIDLSDVEPIHTQAAEPPRVAPAAKRRGLIHGRSPLGLAPPILAADLDSCQWGELTDKRPLRIRAQRRKHKTEKPLTRCLAPPPDFDLKFARRRVVDLVATSARARRANQVSADVSV